MITGVPTRPRENDGSWDGTTTYGTTADNLVLNVLMSMMKATFQRL